MHPYGPSITFNTALHVSLGVARELQLRKWEAAIAIVDAGGHTILLHRLDGTHLGSANVALDKARTAVAFRRATSIFAKALAASAGGSKLLSIKDLCAVEGGLPLILNDQIVGGIGVSGLAPHEDEEMANVGLSTLLQFHGSAG
jgi:glc operon protein GlcG